MGIRDIFEAVEDPVELGNVSTVSPKLKVRAERFKELEEEPEELFSWGFF